MAIKWLLDCLLTQFQYSIKQSAPKESMALPVLLTMPLHNRLHSSKQKKRMHVSYPKQEKKARPQPIDSCSSFRKDPWAASDKKARTKPKTKSSVACEKLPQKRETSMKNQKAEKSIPGVKKKKEDKSEVSGRHNKTKAESDKKRRNAQK